VAHGSGITQAIYNNASTVIRIPATLNKLIVEIEKLDWYSAKTEGLGDMYEGLLEISTMVQLMKPRLDDAMVDPAAGTGGFLISAHHYINQHNDVESLKSCHSCR
ncbi:MAG: N-6 DNA methylase, partial [Ketobacter sp.]